MKNDETIFDLTLLERRKTLTESVYDILRDAIVSRRLPPGEHLVERDIADRLGVSRIPIREAIMQLVEEGMVIKEPHKGARVHPYSHQELIEITSVRVALEQLVVEYAIHNWKTEINVELQQIIEKMEMCTSMEEYEKVYELDYRFHEILWQATHHSILLELVSNLRSRIDQFLREASTSLTKPVLEVYISDHRTLLEVIQSKDIAASKAEIARHIQIASERIQKHYNYLDEGCV